MADISSISRLELNKRRDQLRRKRRVKGFQLAWQITAIAGLAVSMGWVIYQTDWVIRQPSQIQVQGNQNLSEDTVRSLLSLSYPQSILALDPKILTRQLETSAHVAQAQVNRTLFPPQLIVIIAERHPVAIVSPQPLDEKVLAGEQSRSTLPASVGLIDEQGNFMPFRDYSFSPQTMQLPQLRVVGMDQSQYKNWQILYPLIRDSAVKITMVDWRNPANLVLKTSLGPVYIGPYGDRFSEQLNALQQMRKLGGQVNVKHIAFIDLRHPDAPIFELTPRK